MGKSLSNRSGRPYPHNAIYEVLTHGVPYTMRHEPKRYNKRTVNEFWKMLNETNEKTRKAYELVYANGNTLKDAGKIMKISGSTVKKYLMNLYFVKDKTGYLVSDLDKIAKTSLAGPEKTKRGYTMDKIYWFVDNMLPMTSLSKEDALNVLSATADKVSVIGISEFYHYPMEDVEVIVNAYEAYI